MVNDEVEQINTLPAGGEPLVNTEPLRNAPVLPESDSEEEQEQTHTVAHLTPAVPQHIVAWQMTQRYTLEALLWIQFFWSILRVVTAKSIIVGKSVVRALQPQNYVFFKGSDIPYRAQDYTVSGPGVAPIEWYYDAEKYTFISSTLYNTSTDYETHHLSWLSAEIKYNNMVLYDITDHVEQIRWAGTDAPTATHVLSTWSLQSGVVLNKDNTLTLHTLNEDGTESQLPIRV